MTAEVSSDVFPPPVTAAVIGCVAAHLHYQHAFASLSHLKIVAVADSDLSVAKSWARLIGRLPFFPSLTELLEAHPDIQSVVIASPLPERTADIEIALNAGKSVLCDVPFAESLAECDRLCRLAEENSALLMPAFPRRFDPFFADFGALLTVADSAPQIRCERTFTLENAELTTRENTFAARSKTLMEAAASHAIDICLQWLGTAETLSADVILPDAGSVARGRMPQETLVTLLIGQERGQSVVRLTSTRALHTAERCTFIGRDGTLELIASPGTAAATDTPPAVFMTSADQRSVALNPDREPVDRDALLLAHFTDCVQNGAPPLLTCADARAAFEILHAAALSAREGSKISLPLRGYQVKVSRDTSREHHG
jgi:predicted dehydrogenase